VSKREKRGRKPFTRGVGDGHAELRIRVRNEIECITADGFRSERATGDLESRDVRRLRWCEAQENVTRNLDLPIDP